MRELAYFTSLMATRVAATPAENAALRQARKPVASVVSLGGIQFC